MRDTWILALTLTLMLSLMLGGQYLRGDFMHEAFLHAPVSVSMDKVAVNIDGRAMINVNRADAETLTLVDGIGEVLAGRIVDYRRENGPFQTLDDLLKIKGIGKATLERIRQRIVCIP